MMNKYKKGGYMQPSKEIKFGDLKRKATDGDPPKKKEIKYTSENGETIRNDLGMTIKNGAVYDIRGKYLGRVLRPHGEFSGSLEKGDTAAVRLRGKYKPGGTDPNIPKTAREAKHNTPQGTGGGRTGKSGSNAKSQSKTVTPAKKGNSYADAKKKDPKLDSYIKIRNNSEKGSSEHTAAQNKINVAYGKGPQRKVAPVKTAKAPKAKQIDSGVKKDGLQIKKSTPAQKPKLGGAPTLKPKSNTGAGSGMGGVQAEKDKIADLKSTPASSATVDRRSTRKGRKTDRKAGRKDRQTTRQTKREAIKTAKESLKDARKMSAGGKKKMFLGGALGAMAGMKGAKGGFGKKLFGAAKGALGGGMFGRVAGAVGGLKDGGGLQGALEGFKGGAFGNSNPMGQGPSTGNQPVSTEPQATMRKGGLKDRRLRRAKKAHANAAERGDVAVGTRKAMGDPRMLNQAEVPVYAREKRILDRVEKTATNKTNRDDKKKNRKPFKFPKIRFKSRPYIGVGKKNIFGNYKKVRRKKIR